MTKLTGITWDHRRAIDPLLATLPGFRARLPAVEIEWTSRPLHGFEFTPVEELARAFDLIVLDHPFAGDIAATECLLPLDGIVPPATRDVFVGPSLESYIYRGHVWAVPIDAACQVAVSRPDLIGNGIPSTWNEVLDLGRNASRRGHKLAIGLKGVHSLMTFFTLCANLGQPCATEPSKLLVAEGTARTALSLMRELLALCDPRSLDWNSIALHDAMVGRDDLVFCPAVYCYATYAENDQRAPLRFHDFPGPNGHAGSTIGGTGLGISAYCGEREAALAYAGYAIEAVTQFAFARHHGQPARREVWEDKAINDAFRGCYRSTRKTIEAAWIRPRYRGYLRFQAKGGDVIERHLRGETGERATIDELKRLHEQG